MSLLIEASNVSKQYGDFNALNNINLDVETGRIVGLIGPNGAGKTTLLKAILGLANVDGDLKVLGLDPIEQRTELLSQVCFIADTAILPRWMKVCDAIDYVEGVHPKFNRTKAEAFLAKTKINKNKRIATLSKGMITQLHLALVMAIDAKLLVLDEPTLGLDILYRKAFYEELLNNFFDNDRTIIITTHQVEEIEHILTDLVFIQDGELVLQSDMDQIAEQFVQVDVTSSKVEEARSMNPISESSRLGGAQFIFESADHQQFETLGTIGIPSISDLFVAKLSNGAA